MKRVFADTHFFIALLNARDEAHARAVQVESGPRMDPRPATYHAAVTALTVPRPEGAHLRFTGGSEAGEPWPEEG